MREKIKVPRKAYEELMALNREVHFTTDYADIVRKADDRGYKAAVDWLMNNEEPYKIGFAWGFEPVDEMRPAEQSDTEARAPSRKAPAPSAKPSAPQKKSAGFFSRISAIFRRK
jgi:hypothetical protein